MVTEFLGHARRRGAARPGRRGDDRSDRGAEPAPRDDGRADLQRGDVRAVRLRRRAGVPGPARPGRGAEARLVPRSDLAVRGRRAGARAGQLLADVGGHARAEPPSAHRLAPGQAAVQPVPAAGLRPRLRLARPGHRRALDRGGRLRRGARAGPAGGGAVGDGPVRRAAEGLQGHHGGAVPGGRDQGLLHPRAQRAGVPRGRDDRPPDQHAAGAHRGDHGRRHAARRRQARRAHQGAAEDRAADRGGVSPPSSCTRCAGWRSSARSAS